MSILHHDEQGPIKPYSIHFLLNYKCFDSTCRALVALICVCKVGHQWLRKWLPACSSPSHCLNHSRIIVNKTQGNICQWHFIFLLPIICHQFNMYCFASMCSIAKSVAVNGCLQGRCRRKSWKSGGFISVFFVRKLFALLTCAPVWVRYWSFLSKR